MKKVLMIGPERTVKGGMTTVVNTYYENGLDKLVELKYIGSVNDKNIVSKTIKMIYGYLQYIFCLKSYDIVHVHMASRGSVYRKAVYMKKAQKKQKKIILHIHGAEFKVFYNKSTEKEKKKIVQILNLADKLIVLSEEWYDFFAMLVDKSKLVIIYNSVNVPKNFEKNLNTQKILFLGKFGKRKGIYDLLDVMEKLCKDYPNIKLYAGGEGEIEKVKAIVKENQLEDNVKILGWISGEEKEKYLKDVSIYILPSYNEGMPMSVLEGMAYKNVTISTKVGGIPKVINNMENGVLIEPGDKQALYDNLKIVLDNYELRKRLSSKARKTVENKFNIKKNIESLLNLYKNI